MDGCSKLQKGRGSLETGLACRAMNGAHSNDPNRPARPSAPPAFPDTAPPLASPSQNPGWNLPAGASVRSSVAVPPAPIIWPGTLPGIEPSAPTIPTSVPTPTTPPTRAPEPLPARAASVVPQFVVDQAQRYRRKPWQLGGLVELGLALPWLWWSVDRTNYGSRLVGGLRVGDDLRRGCWGASFVR
jgi:hypothetical protein